MIEIRSKAESLVYSFCKIVTKTEKGRLLRMIIFSKENSICTLIVKVGFYTTAFSALSLNLIEINFPLEKKRFEMAAVLLRIYFFL